MNELTDLNVETKGEPLWFSFELGAGEKSKSIPGGSSLSFSMGPPVCKIEDAMARKCSADQIWMQSADFLPPGLPGKSLPRVHGAEQNPRSDSNRFQINSTSIPCTSEAAGLNHLLVRQAEVRDYPKIRDFLLESSGLYPEIGTWWENQVCPTISEGKRVVLIVDSGSDLEGLFIGKIGDSAKLCTLRLRESARNQGVGRVLVAEGLRHLLRFNPSRFHVTISEGAEEGCSPFFESIGFRQVAIERSRYLPGVDEFIYSCDRNEIAEVVKNELSVSMERTLFGAHPRQQPCESTLVMSLRPEYAELILKGCKTIEFRRRFSKKYQGAKIVFYVTAPAKRFMFMATIAQVDHLTNDQLWATHHKSGGVSKNIFDNYFAGTESGYGIHLSNIRDFSNQLDLKRAQQIAPQWRPPQSFQRLDRKSPLMRALDLPICV